MEIENIQAECSYSQSLKPHHVNTAVTERQSQEHIVYELEKVGHLTSL